MNSTVQQRITKHSIAKILVGSVTISMSSHFAARADELADLRARLDAQEQQIKVLQRRLEADHEATQAASAATPTVRAGPGGFGFQSPDAANVIRLRAVLHFDARRFRDDITAQVADTLTFRRIRPTIEGTLNGIYDFRVTPDFAGGRVFILDAFAAARLRAWATITAGKFKVPVGLERLVPAMDLRFIERALPTGLVPNRDLGIQLGGEFSGGAWNYSIGYFNGVVDGGSSDGHLPTADAENDTKGDWAVRVFVQPFLNSRISFLRGWGFGVAATYGDVTGSTGTALLPSYRTPGQQTFFSYRASSSPGVMPVDATFADGERVRIAPQFYYAFGNFSILGEYVKVSQDATRVTATLARSDSIDNTAWHLQVAWFLTGEDESFRGFNPNSVFSLDKGTYGAFELVARYHQLDIDHDAFTGGADSFANPATAASKASAWGVGLNWYLNQNYKLSINYDVTEFDGGAVAGDRAAEKAVFARVAVGF